jgi:prepilin-type processing-associated H-X9-DG protein
MTLMEVAVVLAVLAILAFITINGTIYSRAVQERASRVQCLGNLHTIGIAFRFWSDNHDGYFPMSLSQVVGGSEEFTTGTNAWRHFQAMSNYPFIPKYLVCPTDAHLSRPPDKRFLTPSLTFTFFGNANLSYFVGIDADQTNAASILSGDRNITNGTALKNGVLEATASAPAAWTSSVHDEKGNLLFADGSVRRSDGVDLRAVMAKTGLATNRLQMPVTFP